MTDVAPRHPEQSEGSLQESWTIQRVLAWSTDYLKPKSESPRLDAEVLLAHALGVSRIHLYTHFDKPLSALEREPFKKYLMRRGGGEPVAYITGLKEFMGHAFAVSRAVLIPRPDTEVLVETALAEASTLAPAGRPLRVLDVGTGSGCIAIALALRLKGTTIEAWDVADEALVTARANAERLKASVDFRAVDALTDGAWEEDSDAFHMIVSNPPYIADAEAASLAKNVVDYEPRRALFAADAGLAFYRRFACGAERRLVPNGKLLVEVGASQGRVVADLLTAAGWRDVRIKKDYARLDRVVIATVPSSSTERGTLS